MSSIVYERIAITMPERMAEEINRACEVEGRNRSEFIREAVRYYFAAKKKGVQFLMPSEQEERGDNPFHAFNEWASEADSIYDSLR